VTWPSRWRGALAAAAVIVAFVLASADLQQHYRLPVGGALLLGAARALPLVLCWFTPRTAVATSATVALTTALVSVPVSSGEPWPWTVSGLLGHAAVLVVLGARSRVDRRAGRVTLVIAWLATQAAGAIAIASLPDRGSWADLWPSAALTAVALAVAELLRSREDIRSSLVHQQQLTDIERAHRARSEERDRIARELHDVVAHHLSVVVVRADSAPHRLTYLDESVRAELAAIADEARGSLEAMRRVLRLLRADDADRGPRDADRVPQPALGDLDALITGARAAGADVQMSGEIPRGDGVSQAVQLTVYRVVQEAVSNALRHAPGAAIRIRLHDEAQQLSVRVENEPPPRRPAVTASGGQGLVGMAERVAMLDGTLIAEPSPQGGFIVVATIAPLAEAQR